MVECVPSTAAELRASRQALRLTPEELAAVCETDVTTIYKMERDETQRSHRPPPARVARLIHAYLSGYRPPDWPERVLELEEILK